jgi:hypothetical protein
MRTIQEVAIGITAALCGLAVWQVISSSGGMQEAWDSPEYFLTGIPVMMLTAVVCGFVSAQKPWRWGLAVVCLQPVALYSQGQAGPLLVVGLAMFGVIAILCILAAYGGAGIKHLIDRRRPKT